MSNKDFYFTNLRGDGGGPHIFCERLKEELTNQGLKHSPDSINRLSIISGQPKKDFYNILRLDGLYFQSGSKENAEIFQSYKTFDHIIFQGEFCRDQYEAFTGIKRPHSIIPNGVPYNFFTPCKGASRPQGFSKVLIASSSWRRHKRLEEVIEAFHSPLLKDVALVILGGFKNPHFTQPNIFSLPKIDYKDLAPYYQMADAMVHLAWLDWCPNTVVEGLASGLPVLCSHNGGTKELVKQDGIVLQLEEDYRLGSELDLYSPPKVDVNLIIDGVLKIVEMPKIKTRNDLRISNVAVEYSKVFNYT